jgi:hypothetical protein
MVTEEMKFSWKYAASGIVIIAICAGAIVWQTNKVRASRSLTKDVETYKLKAQNGDPIAEEKLESLYDHGLGVPQDYSEALRLYSKSAEQGNARAQYAIGAMYELGHGVQQDYAEALHWYREAADHGEADAQSSIGSMYYYGRGVQQDQAQAYGWYHRAADQGLARAEYDLGFVYDHGRGVGRDPTQAYYWYRKAADQGYESAERALGFKGRFSSAWSLIVIAMLLGYGWVLKDAKLPSFSYRIWSIPAQILAALLGLVYVGMGVIRIFAIFHTVLAVNTYDFIGCLFLGLSISASFKGFSQPPGKAKLALGVAMVLLVGANSFVAAHRSLAPFSLVFRDLFSVDGLLAGIIVPTIASLWLLRARPTIHTAT